MRCVKGLEVKPLKSAAGWYLGTLDENNWPNCRITTNYYSTPQEALDNLSKDYRHCMENEYCSHGLVCVEGI